MNLLLCWPCHHREKYTDDGLYTPEIENRLAKADRALAKDVRPVAVQIEHDQMVVRRLQEAREFEELIDRAVSHMQTRGEDKWKG